MKILSYSTYFYPYISGITMYQVRLWNILVKRNKITVLTFPAEHSSPSISVDKKIKIIRMPYVFKISKGFISVQSLLYFFNECRKNDVIVLNLPNFEAFPLAVIAKLMKKRIISIFQCEVYLGNDLISKIITYFLNISMNIQLTLSDEIIAIPEYIETTKIGKRYWRKINAIIPPIEEIKTDLKHEKKYKMIKSKKIWIGFLGRISREKGVQYLIEAVEILQKNNKAIELVIVGPSGKDVAGEDLYYNQILTLLNNRKISYILLGLLSEKELGALIKNLDVLVLPSINHTEAFGMVQPEAMLLGVPVVASDLPGVRMPVKLTGMGELAKRADANSIAEKIEKILNDKKSYIKKSEIVKKIFNSRSTAKKIEGLLNTNK